MVFQIQSMGKAILPNDLHDEFMQECVEIVNGIQETENEKFSAMKTKFVAAFAEEEKWFKQTTANPSLEKLYQLSKARMHVYSGMRLALKAVAMAKLDGADSTAILLRHFNLYQRNLKTSVEGLTAIVRNLLNELSKEAEQQAITATNTMAYYTKLQTLNDEVKEQTKLCRKYDSQYVNAALKKAREAMDTAYDEAVKIMEGAANMFGGSFEEAILLWNASISKYKATLKARQAAREAAKKKDPNANPPTDVKPQGNTQGEQTPGNQPNGQTDQQAQGSKPNVNPDGAKPQPDAKPDAPAAGTDNQKPSTGTQGGSKPGDSQVPSDQKPNDQKPNGSTGGIITDVTPEQATV